MFASGVKKGGQGDKGETTCPGVLCFGSSQGPGGTVSTSHLGPGSKSEAQKERSQKCPQISGNVCTYCAETSVQVLCRPT